VRLVAEIRALGVANAALKVQLGDATHAAAAVEQAQVMSRYMAAVAADEAAEQSG
jgi:hypothetical protein